MTDQTMNDLLDETLDDLADLPASAPFPAGAHMAQMFLSRQKDKPSSYIAKFKYEAPLELVSPTAVAPKAGDESTLFLHTKKKDGTVNEMGQGQLKLLLLPLSERSGSKSINELLEMTKSGIGVGITTGIRKQSEGYPDQMTVVKISLQ